MRIAGDQHREMGLLIARDLEVEIAWCIFERGVLFCAGAFVDVLVAHP